MTQVRRPVPHNRDLALLVSGSGVSNMGSMLTLTGLTTALHGSGPYAVAGLFVSCTVGSVIGSPLAGWLVDRYPNRRLLVGTLISQALILACVFAALPLRPALFALMALLGLSGAVVGTCASVLIPLITGEDEAMRGYSWLTSAEKAGSMSGTVLGGVITAGPGIKLALILDAVTSLIQAMLIRTVRAERDPRRTTAEVAKPGHPLTGFSYLTQDRLLLGRMLAQTAGTVAVAIVLVNEIFWVTGTLGGGNFTYSVMLVCWSIGTILGAQASRRLKATRALLMAGAIGNGVLAVALLTPALLPYIAVNTVACVIAGGGSSVQNVTLNGLVQARTLAAVRGRMFAAVNAVLVGANTLSILSAGVVVTVVGPRCALVVAASFAGLATAIAFAVTACAREPRTAMDVRDSVSIAP
jgi:MFS family permease